VTRSFYDGVTAADLPADAQMVGGYVDGRYAWSAADWARFPRAVKVRIAVSSYTNDGHVLDVEPGNEMNPNRWVAWVQMRRRAGADPTIYMSASNWPSVAAAFHNAGVAAPHYWVAHWWIAPVIPNGAVALQYRNTPGYDESVAADYWPGVDPAPSSPSGSSSGQSGGAGGSIPMVERDQMALLIMTSPPVDASPTIPGTDYYLLSGNLVAHFPTGEYQSAVNLALKLGNAVAVSNAFVHQLLATPAGSAATA
jgi:hypothetical protein